MRIILHPQADLAWQRVILRNWIFVEVRQLLVKTKLGYLSRSGSLLPVIFLIGETDAFILLEYIFIWSIQYLIFRSQGKASVISLFPKNGTRSKPLNHRPIKQVPKVCRAAKRSIKVNIIGFFPEHWSSYTKEQGCLQKNHALLAWLTAWTLSPTKSLLMAVPLDMTLTFDGALP